MPEPSVPDSVGDTIWQRERGALNGTLVAMAKADRTSESWSSVIVNPGARGAYMIVDVDTAAADQNLVFNIQIRDPTDGSFNIIYATPQITAAGEYVYFIYPAAIEDPGTLFTDEVQIAMPRYFNIYVNHSSTGTWNYSVSISFLP